jgi:amino acid adenylation domain-containing protein
MTSGEFGQSETVSIVGLFEAQARQTPDALALTYEGEGIDYRRLDARSTQLAHHLRDLGVRPETLVGVFLERSIEAVVAILAVLKAGGAYVPLDPAYPQSRLLYMLNDSGAAVLLTERRLEARLPAVHDRLVRLDADAAAIARRPTDGLACGATPHSPVYVIYTSGSTGRPKGVVGLHGSAVNRLSWTWERYPFGHAEVYCHKTALSFVDSFAEIFVPLLKGVTNVIIPPALANDVHRMLGALAESRVTRIVLVPSLLRAMLDAAPDLGRRLPAMRYVVSSGERLPKDLAALFAERMPHGRLINLYGSTEVMADVTFYELSGEGQAGPVPIGRPIPNTHAFVLDERLEPVPNGEPGELYASGACLARGYFNQPALTAERFLPCPFAGRPGARMYRTGDLARLLPDGNLEYFGRTDHQVQIRGQRVELGEVEAVILEHPAALRCVVRDREDHAGERQLVAFLVTSDDAPPDVKELREYVGRKLPAYMVPAVFVRLDALPLTPSGKIDSRALSSIKINRRLSEAGLVSPRTPVEEILAGIWSDVFGVEEVGVEDNFFELGGHSLSGAQVVSRIRHVFELEVPLHVIFEAPTVAALARELTALLKSDGGGFQSIARAKDRRQFPVTMEQERWLAFLREHPELPPHFLGGAFRVSGPLDARALEESLGEVINRHEALRTTFPLKGGEPVQAVRKSPPFALPHVDLRGLPRAGRLPEALRCVTSELRRPRDTARDTVTIFTLYRLEEEAYVLSLWVNHLVADAWAMEVFYRELTNLYGLRRGSASARPLPAVPVQYGDFAAWQREWLRGPQPKADLEYWQGQLRDAPDALLLPADRPRARSEGRHGGTVSFELPATLAAGLRSLGRRRGATLFMVLLAAFKALLYRRAGQSDIVVGCPVANRGGVETENVIGFFANLLLLRTRLSDDPSFLELLGRVREAALGAYAHQNLPYPKLLGALREGRDLNSRPLFRIQFGLENAPHAGFRLEGLALEFLEVEDPKAKLDLTLFVFEEHETLKGSLVYDADLFERHTVERLAESFLSLLEGAARDAGRPLSELPLD